MNVSVADARNNLTRILQRVEKGEKITICRHGKPVVDWVPSSSARREPRKFATLKGKIKILDHGSSSRSRESRGLVAVEQRPGIQEVPRADPLVASPVY